MTTQESNRLIAYYMGYYESPYPNLPNRVYTKRNGKEFAISVSNLTYHDDWNQLMEVIERISLIPLIGATDHDDTCYPRTFNMPTEDGKRMFRFNGFACHEGYTLIQAAYSAVVEAIQIINSQKESNEKG